MKPTLLSVLSVIIAAAIFVLAIPNTVSAQYQLPPAISPWMSMFQSSRGNPLGNYQTYVKPQMDMMNEFKSQGQAIQQQSAHGHQLEKNVDKVLDMPRKHPPIGGQPGCGFGQHIHFYQNMGAAPVPNFSTPKVGGRVHH